MATELHIPSDAQIPYVNQVVVLSEIFRLLKHPTPAQLREVKRWFWRTAIGGYFGGWNTGNMAADQLAVRAFAAGKTDRIETSVANPGREIWLTQQFRSNAAHSKILILLLAVNEPIDLLTSQRIDTRSALYQGNTKEFHHFFPRDYLIKRGEVFIRNSNLLANIVMITAKSNKKITNRAPSEYLKDVQVALGGELHNALRRNLISDEAFGAALRDDYDGFLSQRAKTIELSVRDLTGWRSDTAREFA